MLKYDVTKTDIIEDLIYLEEKNITDKELLFNLANKFIINGNPIYLMNYIVYAKNADDNTVLKMLDLLFKNEEFLEISINCLIDDKRMSILNSLYISEIGKDKKQDILEKIIVKKCGKVLNKLMLDDNIDSFIESLDKTNLKITEKIIFYGTYSYMSLDALKILNCYTDYLCKKEENIVKKYTTKS